MDDTAFLNFMKHVHITTPVPKQLRKHKVKTEHSGLKVS